MTTRSSSVFYWLDIVENGEEDPISGTYLLILEPYRMVDTRMFQSNLLSIYAYGTNIGIFPLDGAEEAISKLLSCDLQRTLDKFAD